jgi:hypothetical protein
MCLFPLHSTDIIIIIIIIIITDQTVYNLQTAYKRAT